MSNTLGTAWACDVEVTIFCFALEPVVAVAIFDDIEGLVPIQRDSRFLK